jgi:hypothetical protein
VVVSVTVVGGDQTHRPHPVARLLVDLPDGAFSCTLADVCPPARHRPATVVGLLDEQDTASPERRRPDVHLGGRGARLELKQLAGALDAPGGMGGQNLRR